MESLWENMRAMSAVERINRQKGIQSLVHDQMNQLPTALTISGLTLVV